MHNVTKTPAHPPIQLNSYELKQIYNRHKAKAQRVKACLAALRHESNLKETP